MTPLNTIIEEEIQKFDTKNPALAWKVNNHLHEALTTAMQRAYEAGREERDTYWKERVRKEVDKAVDECVKIVNNKVRWAKDADPDEVYEEMWVVKDTLLDNLK